MMRIVFATDECVWSLTAMRRRARRIAGACRARVLRVRRRAPRGSRPSRPTRTRRRAAAGRPARSLRNRSAWFSACTAPAASSHEMPEIDAHDTIMSNSSDGLRGRGGDERQEPRAVARDHRGREHLAVELEHVRRDRCPRGRSGSAHAPRARRVDTHDRAGPDRARAARACTRTPRRRCVGCARRSGAWRASRYRRGTTGYGSAA